MKVVLCFPPMPESMIDDAEQLLRCLADQPFKPELEVNDWGVLSLLKQAEFRSFSKTLGVQLCKRRKDPRVHSLPGAHLLPARTSIDVPEFREWIERNFGSVRYSFENVSEIECNDDTSVLFWPLMQLNSSGNCTLKAACETGDRGMQSCDTNCKQYCWTHAFFYPDRMRTLGKYNSLFGLDDGVCTIRSQRIVVDIP